LRTLTVTDRATDPTGGTAFTVLSGDGDDPQSWLRGREALSAVLLAAVHKGLSVSPMSDVAEAGAGRELLRSALDGIGYPRTWRCASTSPNPPPAYQQPHAAPPPRSST
jgi:hypothetical protein